MRGNNHAFITNVMKQQEYERAEFNIRSSLRGINIILPEKNSSQAGDMLRSTYTPMLAPRKKKLHD